MGGKATNRRGITRPEAQPGSRGTRRSCTKPGLTGWRKDGDTDFGLAGERGREPSFPVDLVNERTRRSPEGGASSRAACRLKGPPQEV